MLTATLTSLASPAIWAQTASSGERTPMPLSQTQAQVANARFEQARKLMLEADALFKLRLALPSNYPFEDGYRRALSIAESQAKDTGKTALLEAVQGLNVTTSRHELARADAARFKARDLYTAAIAALERLAQDDPDNAVLLRPLAHAYSALGVIAGSDQVRIARQEKALAIVQKLAARNPGDRELKREQATIQLRIGANQFSQSGERLARSAKMAELDLREKLVEAEPANGEWQHDLALNYDRLGDMFHTIGNRTQAHDAFKAGFEVHERLAKMDPNNVQWQRDLATNRVNAGLFEDRNGKEGVGEAMLKDALRLHQEAIEKRPLDPIDQLALRDSYLRAGRDLTGGRRDEGIAVYETAIAHFKRLAAQDPANPAWLYYQLEFYFLIGYEHEVLLGNALGGPRLGSSPEDQRRRVQEEKATAATFKTMLDLIADLLVVSAKAPSGNSAGLAAPSYGRLK